ncbi:MAG: hypothetical protein Q4G43_06055 [Mobilicoccus sp.]|nr:hypothetical protein [Mobilicoccus sp.]
MSRTHVINLLVGLLLTAITFLGVLYQVNETMAANGTGEGSLPQLICPLH